MRHRLPDWVWALGFLCLANATPSRADESCSGSPFVNVVRPREIEESAGTLVGPQIFEVAQHPRGFLLMGNNSGLLSYDGVSWRLTPLGRSAVALSVAVAPDGRIFAGGSRTFGEVVEDPAGQLLYQPLESRLRPADRNFSDIWQTLVSPQGVVYFRSRERLIALANNDVHVFSPTGRFTAVGFAAGVLYAQDTAKGMVAVSGSTISAVEGGEAFRNINVTALSEGPGGSVLVGTQDQGLFSFDPQRGVARALSRRPELATSDILSVRQVASGQIAVGTLRSGLFMLGPDGTLQYRLDRDSGLPDNAVLSLEVANGSLWAGTSGGVAQLLVPSPLQTFSAREGLPGLVESMVRHQGSVYAATSEGVFRMTCGAHAFEPVAGFRRQAFSLLAAGSLLAATADGIFEITEAGARLVRAGLARGFARSKDQGRLWAATQIGVVLLTHAGDHWAAGPVLKIGSGGDDDPNGVEATSVGEDADGRVVAALVTGRVVAGVPSESASGTELAQARIFGEAAGISGGFAEIIALKDGVRIGTASSVLRLAGDGLVRDAALAQALGPGKGAFRIRDAADGGYWVASAKRPRRLMRDVKGRLSARATALLRIPAGSRILDFLEVSETEVWVGTDDGAYVYDPSADARAKTTIAAHIRRVVSNRTDLFSGGRMAALETALPHLASLRFSFSSTSLDDPSRNRFRFRLEGAESEWSLWSTETRKDYTNLGAGAYRFVVETEDVYGRGGTAGEFSFVVLTPWYQKPLAIGFGVAGVFGLFLGASNLRTRALLKRQRELETIVEQKTSELREASFTDPLTGLRNRRYFADVIDAESSLAGRPGSPALHMFLIDLDHFKQVNDTHGHAAGDQVLRQTAARLKTATRTSDLIFRWGGEEFLIVARGAGDLPRNEIANRIVRMMGKEPFDIGTGTPLSKTCSVGFATYPFYPDTPLAVALDVVIELADLALYRAKHTGRNRAVGVSPRPGEPAPGELWKNMVLEKLENASVSVEVLEGPAGTD